jgi:uncharacterized protein (DUF1684 family)
MNLNERKPSTLIVLIVGLLFIVIAIAQYFSVRNPNPYIQKIELQRDQKDRQFKYAMDSPIPEAEREAFTQLSYFAPDSRYRVPAVFTADAAGDTLFLPTTSGEDYVVIKAGELAFTLQDRAYKLTAYRYTEPSKEGELFVPFRDLTSKASTYGGGRYLDVPATTDEIFIDFNLAYNPYCVYNVNYSCPLPPEENKLLLEVLAGEKNYPE